VCCAVYRWLDRETIIRELKLIRKIALEELGISDLLPP
jgi:hypothetical protein